MINKIIKEIHDYVIFDSNELPKIVQFKYAKLINYTTGRKIHIPLFCDVDLNKDHFTINDIETKLILTITYDITVEELFQLGCTGNIFNISIDSITKLWYIKRKLFGV